MLLPRLLALCALIILPIASNGRDLSDVGSPAEPVAVEKVSSAEDFAKFVKQGCECACDCQEGDDDCECECACPNEQLRAATGMAVSNAAAPENMVPAGYESFTKEEPEEGKVGVIWLMSFPNSGTSFTLHLVRTSTNYTTGTNYALEGDIKDQPSEPVFPGEKGLEGPFYELIPNVHTTEPKKYILTKTHCHGFCGSRRCPNYIHTSRSFQMGCRSGFRAVKGENGEMEQVRVTYDKEIVKAAIHLFRHPLDNIVARHHLEINDAKAAGDMEFVEAFPKGKEGFIKWCEHQDKDRSIFQKWVISNDPRLRFKMREIPCFNEFFKYVQWHNYAFTTTQDMGIPSMTLHYDEYDNNLESTLDRILDFVEIPKDGERVEFIKGKLYRDYYTPEQKANILEFLKEFSSQSTKKELLRYDYS